MTQQGVTNKSITNNTNNAKETERSKKSRKVIHYASTPYFVERQQQHCLFFNNHLDNDDNDMNYKTVLPGNTSYSGIT